MRNRLDAADHLAQDQHRRRHHDDAEQGHHGILHRHDRGKPDERKQIATDRRDEEVEHLACRGGAGREPRHELGAMAVGKKTDVMLEQLREHSLLIVGDDPVADAREHDRLAIGGHSLDHENHGGHEGEDDDAGKVLVDVRLVDHVADQIGAERSARRGNSHQAECERIASPLAGRLLHEQPSDQSAGAVRVREQSLKIRVEHARSVARPDCSGDAWRAVLAQAGAVFKRNRRVRKGSAGARQKLALPCQRVAHDGWQVVEMRLPFEQRTGTVGSRHAVAPPVTRTVMLGTR